jgi:subtilase family serine protease
MKETRTFATLCLISLCIVACLPEVAFAAPRQSINGRTAHTYFHLYNSKHVPENNFNSYASLAPTALSPAQVKKAYNLPEVGGTGTIAVVDAYDCPTVQSDLGVFSQQFGLPAENFEKHMMTSNITVDAGWALEISLDVQWVHAIATNAKILLVEAKSASLVDLLAAVSFARNRADVVAVSMSWGGDEFDGQSAFNSYFTSNHGVAFFASTGDAGAGVIWPSSSSNVVAVGGTTLILYSNGSVASETAWSGSGGGISAYETEPQFQINYNVSGVGGKRSVPDVCYDADPASGFPVYDSTAYDGQTGWFQVGGTSASCPQWAAIHSLCLSVSNNNLYQDAKWNGPFYFRDITSGSNGDYSAIQGYDFVTGLGSPLTWNYTTGIGSGFTISASPSTIATQNGTLVRSNISITSVNGFAGRVSLSANAPDAWSASCNSSSIVVPLGGSNQTMLSVATSSGAQEGGYNVTIKGSSGLLECNTTLTVNVAVPITPAIVGFNVQSGGSGYTTPAVIIAGGGGTGAKATARVSNGVVFSVVLTNPGSGYTSAPTVTLRDPSPRARGATAVALMGP